MKQKKNWKLQGYNVFYKTGKALQSNTDLVVVSTAIEDTVAEVQKAKHCQYSHHQTM